MLNKERTIEHLGQGWANNFPKKPHEKLGLLRAGNNELNLMLREVGQFVAVAIAILGQ